MPMLKAHIQAGYSRAVRETLLKSLTDCVVQVLKAPLQQVRVMIEMLEESGSAVGGQIDQPLAIIQVWMMEGRTIAQKESLVEALTLAAADALDMSAAAVRILIFDMPKINVGIGGKTAQALGR